jgi:hypothetical protein
MIPKDGSTSFVPGSTNYWPTAVAVTAIGHREITEHLDHYQNHVPWHVCFAVGLCWGRLARLDLEFTGAAVRLIQHWNDRDLRLARRFHYERSD